MITFGMFIQLMAIITILTVICLVIMWVSGFLGRSLKGLINELFAFHLTYKGIVDTDKMSGVEFEVWLKKKFQKMGYQVKTTSRTGDGGADLVLTNPSSGKKIAVQAKQSSKNTIGVKAVSEVMRGMKVWNCDEAWVVTNQYFTNQAYSDGKKCGVKMIDRDKLAAMMDRLQKKEQQKNLKVVK